MSSDESDSELSNLDSIITSDKPEDDVVVSERNNWGAPKISSGHLAIEDNMGKGVRGVAEESMNSHYPKRKRTSFFYHLSEGKLESTNATTAEDLTTLAVKTNTFEPNRQSLGRPDVKGVLLGTWRDSSVPDNENKHAVIGFIDARDRLRTRILPNTKHGKSLAEDYPLPSSPSGCWVTFERVLFSDHLVGLNRSQVKEYIRLRSEAAPEETEDGRLVAEYAAVRKAIRLAKENPALGNPAQPPEIAYGVDVPEYLTATVRLDINRRCVTRGVAAIEPPPPRMTPRLTALPSLQQSVPNHGTRFSIGPLSGTRPTRILVGYWKLSSEGDPNDCHAVYGVLGQNGIFRVKVVQETRDGRFVDGNYPHGTGAQWIPFAEVELEPHLKALGRQEVKEYCRVRQHQLDHDETSAERIGNETKAVYEAQVRAAVTLPKQPHHVKAPTLTASSHGDSCARLNGRHGFSGHELRHCRTEPPSTQTSQCEEPQPTRPQRLEAVRRPNALAHRETARAEATQGRADPISIHKERAVPAAVVDAADTAEVAIAAASNMLPEHDQAPLNESEYIQRLNKARTPQETLHTTSSLDDVKMYNGDKYERKVTGPFMGKLVSQGMIINIDGEDYVEYRVLTRPWFF